MKNTTTLTITISVVIIILATFLIQGTLIKKDNLDIDENGYQAVFLDNGQVYFGKLENSNEEFLGLTNIYYLQYSQSPPTGSEQINLQSSEDIQLVKRGREFHQPEDEMLINQDRILIIEALQEDSNIINAIKEFENTEQ